MNIFICYEHKKWVWSGCTNLCWSNGFTCTRHQIWYQIKSAFLSFRTHVNLFSACRNIFTFQLEVSRTDVEMDTKELLKRVSKILTPGNSRFHGSKTGSCIIFPELVGVKFGYELRYFSCPVKMAPHRCYACTNGKLLRYKMLL